MPGVSVRNTRLAWRLVVNHRFVRARARFLTSPCCATFACDLCVSVNLGFSKARIVFQQAQTLHHLPHVVIRQKLLTDYVRAKRESPNNFALLATLRQQLPQRYEEAKEDYKNGTLTGAFLLDYDCQFTIPICANVLRCVKETLRGLPIDVDCRTDFMKRVLATMGGAHEKATLLAARCAMHCVETLPLVRAIDHGHQSTFLAELEEQDANEIAALDEKSISRKRKQCDVDTGSIAAVELSEDEKIAAMKRKIGQEYAHDDMQLDKTRVSVFCVTCDVIGHHTRDCPRQQFIAALEEFVGFVKGEHFAPHSGVFGSANSKLALFARKNEKAQAGVMTAHIRAREYERQAIERILPAPPLFDLRWVADRSAI